ncbi:MAG: serine/threonine-protein kinase [Isosphaeraceae bacterium]
MIGQKLGTFLIEAKIGSGAMGTVYRAVQETSGRVAAIKIINGEHALKGNAAGRFRRESDILQQFRHPNIVRCLAVGRSQGTLYFAMEFVAGGTLDQLLVEREFLSWREVVNLGLQMCEALHYAHERGVVHRDLKPANLLINEAGQVKLTDFGIAKDLDATALTGTGRTLGTAGYMAPEQIRGTPEVSHKTDLYALGCVLYELLTGQLPFTGKSAVALMHHHLTTPPPKPSDKNPEMPVALEKLILSLMAKDPPNRPWDAAAAGLVLSELKEKAERGEPIPMVYSQISAPARLGPTQSTTTSAAETLDLTATSAAAATGVTAATRKKKKRKAKSKSINLTEHLGTIGLAASGLVVAALIVYVLLPPGAQTLYRRADALMKSEEHSNWRLAKREAIDELTRRFPDHRKAEVQAWNKKIALDVAEGRADALEHPNLLKGTKPKNEVEELFLNTSRKAEEASKIGLETEALTAWRRMHATLTDQLAKFAASLSDKERFEALGWQGLALARAGAVEEVLTKRRQAVMEQLNLANAAAKAGKTETALELYRKILAKYGTSPDLADLLGPLRTSLPPEDPQDPPEPPGEPEETENTSPSR